MCVCINSAKNYKTTFISLQNCFVGRWTHSFLLKGGLWQLKYTGGNKRTTKETNIRKRYGGGGGGTRLLPACYLLIKPIRAVSSFCDHQVT